MKPTGIVLRAATLSLFAGLSAASLPALAQVSVNINVAPPPPRYEAVPVVPSGYVWAPGYWAWNGNRYDWVRGHRIAQRDGYRWVPDHWEPGNRYRAGYWEAERHDGRRDEHRHRDREYREHREERNERDHREGFCPPGQAKKGNC